MHLVGHSYGAMLSLEAARLLGPRVASLTLVEPVSFQLLAPGGRTRNTKQIARVAARVQAAMQPGSQSARRHITWASGWGAHAGGWPRPG